MANGHIRTSSLVLAALLAGCSGEHQALADRVNAVMEPLAAANEFSGAVVMIRKGRIIYQRGFGMANHAANTPFTPETPADGGSLAKTLTAAGIWQLAYEGRIDVDAPVSRYVREYPFAGTTVRHLISHTNGLPPYYEFWDPYFGPDEARTTTRMLDIVARELAAPAFTPGTRFEYSNFGFDVAALVIERVSGLPIGKFLEQRFFSRFGMDGTFARPARFADWPGIRTLGYRWGGGWQVVDVYDMEAFIGSSNVYFPVTDLARWASANAAGTAIAPAAYAAGQQRSLIDGKPSPITGLSWNCDDSMLHCYYTGSINAFHGMAYWDRTSNEAIAFIANSAIPPWKTITLQRDLVAALDGRPVTREPPADFLPIDEAARGALAGTWTADGRQPLTITAREGGLVMQEGFGLQFDVFQVGRDAFYAPGPDYWIAFSGGGPPVMHVRSMFKDFVATRSQ